MADVIAARVRFSGSAFGTLTAIGVNNTLIGFMVAGIVGEFSAVVLVPLISSAAVSLANGLYWYWNSDYLYTANARAAAAAFSIFAFMVSATRARLMGLHSLRIHYFHYLLQWYYTLSPRQRPQPDNSDSVAVYRK